MSCPVCFGGDDLAVRESLNAGIGVLLGVTAVVLAVVARFIVRLARRSREHAHLVGLEGVGLEGSVRLQPDDRHVLPQPDDPSVGLLPDRGERLVLEWLRMPVAASAHAGQVDQIMVLVHWLMLVLFVGWSTFFLYLLVRFRKSRHPVANYHGVRGWWSNLAEGGVLVAEVVLIAFFSVPVWSSRVDALPSEDEATVVRIVAEQFSWNIHYPGADKRFGRTTVALVGPDNPLGLDRDDPAGKDDITSINQFKMPLGKPVLVILSSKDVVHSFALPQMRVKQDAIPGIVQPVWFTPTLAGQWDIACSQLCGLGHAQMRGQYQVMSQSEYQAWLDEEALYIGL